MLRRFAGLDGTGTDALVDEDIDEDRARPGELLEREAYSAPIIQALAQRGGSAPAHEVVEQVGQILRDRLTEKDLTKNRSGVVRWRNRTMWRRAHLVKDGLIKDDSPRGIWELTEAGWDEARE